jgi:L-alanine-DL-glutamate epimerase-like enolase superfamily enzyme
VTPPTYERLRDLPLHVEGYELESLAAETTSGFTRVSTVIHLGGGAHEGLGEDVTYEASAHLALSAAGPVLALAARTTLDGFSQRLDELDLFPVPPEQEGSRRHRRWAFESAALDLALRQSDLSLGGALGRTPRPVAFVVSTRLGEPPDAGRVHRWLARDPTLRFKLDATASWDEDLIAELAATGAVVSVDLKGAYSGTVVDAPPDPALYRRVAEGFPQAWIEDPNLTEETAAVLAPHRERITWDAPIGAVADIEALPFPPRTLNVKPSRFGTLRELMRAYDHMAAHGIAGYGGGQFELGPGRGQVQYLASLFHPDGPNDVAPGGYNELVPPPVLPPSPLPPVPAPTGFRWG